MVAPIILPRAHAHAYPVCHREERGGVGIALLQETPAAITRLPRCARNDSSGLRSQ